MKAHHNGSRSQTQDPLDLVRDDLSAIKRDITALVGDRMGGAAERARNSLASAGEGIGRLSEFSKEQARLAHKRLSKTAGEHPLKTIGAAAAGGAIGVMILSRMWRRSDE